MEFSDVGDYCHLKGCNTQDFMPFTCPYCETIFCQDHRRSETHNCQSGSLTKGSRFIALCKDCDSSVAYQTSGLESKKTSEEKNALQAHKDSGECALKQKTM